MDPNEHELKRATDIKGALSSDSYRRGNPAGCHVIAISCHPIRKSDKSKG